MPAHGPASYGNGSGRGNIFCFTVQRKLAAYSDGIAAIASRLHLAHIGDLPFENGFREFAALYIVFIEMLLLERFFKFKSLHQHAEFELAGALVNYAYGGIIVRLDIFKGSF